MKTCISAAAAAVLTLTVVAAFTTLYIQRGTYGVNAVLRRGGSYWVTITPTDPNLPLAMRTALMDPPPEAVSGAISWKTIAPGFDITELPVLVAHVEVDRFLLARIDPAHYRFVTKNAPDGSTYVEDWLQALGAVFVINGSYYDLVGQPDTPFVSDGIALGPTNYHATHGAFVVTAGIATIKDLTEGDWRNALRGAENAMVSYPLLFSAERRRPDIKATPWLANRSFVGQDRSGRIILGTTKEAFFSLNRLGPFLQSAPLDLIAALNLDGGPVACQAIALGNEHHHFCGQWETQVRGGKLQLLRWPYGEWPLPIALAVVPK